MVYEILQSEEKRCNNQHSPCEVHGQTAKELSGFDNTLARSVRYVCG